MELFKTKRHECDQINKAGANVLSVTGLYIKWQEQFTHSQHVCVDIRRIQHAGDRLHKNKESYHHQEQAIDEPGEYFNAPVPTKTSATSSLI